MTHIGNGSIDTRQPTGSGFGRLLVAVYAILAIAATMRGVVQLTTHGSQAPLAYSLSLLAGIIYIVATIALGVGHGRWRTVAWVACSIELVVVLAVGVATIVDPDAFPDATVWSNFGQGYGYIPLVLPIVGLVWLWRTRLEPSGRGAATPGPAVTDRTAP